MDFMFGLAAARGSKGVMSSLHNCVATSSASSGLCDRFAGCGHVGECDERDTAGPPGGRHHLHLRHRRGHPSRLLQAKWGALFMSWHSCSVQVWSTRTVSLTASQWGRWPPSWAICTEFRLWQRLLFHRVGCPRQWVILPDFLFISELPS